MSMRCKSFSLVFAPLRCLGRCRCCHGDESCPSTLALPRSIPPCLSSFSIDDTVLPSVWNAAYQQTIVASQARNPNGCRPPATW
jgi:hypothetical protein